MRHFLYTIVFILIINNFVIAQFLIDKPIMALPSNLNGELDQLTDKGLFDPSRLNISHSFGISMISSRGIPNSITSLSNQLDYKISDNLQFDANIDLYMSNFTTNHFGSLNKINVLYDAGITFKPTNNSFLKLQIQKLPNYQIYQNHLQPRYRFIR
tara:strand:- start:211 stop:678 length:468 start_codon:yes stop_codon:yes gene_type:complete